MDINAVSAITAARFIASRESQYFAYILRIATGRSVSRKDAVIIARERSRDLCHRFQEREREKEKKETRSFWAGHKSPQPARSQKRIT